jgi:hypothetical protein
MIEKEQKLSEGKIYAAWIVNVNDGEHKRRQPRREGGGAIKEHLLRKRKFPAPQKM